MKRFLIALFRPWTDTRLLRAEVAELKRKSRIDVGANQELAPMLRAAEVSIHKMQMRINELETANGNLHDAINELSSQPSNITD